MGKKSLRFCLYDFGLTGLVFQIKRYCGLGMYRILALAS